MLRPIRSTSSWSCGPGTSPPPTGSRSAGTAAQGGREERLRGIKELGDLEPGKSGALTMTLKPGHYVLFCNEPGHFKAGMYAELVVTR